jgi:hypothetical protein
LNTALDLIREKAFDGLRGASACWREGTSKLSLYLSPKNPLPPDVALFASDHDAVVGYFTLPAPVLSATLSGSGNFGGVDVGSRSPAQSFTLTNTGEGDLGLDHIKVTEDFSQSNNCGAVLKVGSSCSINVIFAPTVPGPRRGELRVIAGGSSYHAALSGTGIPRYDAAIRVQYGRSHLVYPESTELKVCIDSSKRVEATGMIEVYDGSRLLTKQHLQDGGCAYRSYLTRA